MKEGTIMSGSNNNNNSFGRMDNKQRVPSGCLIIKKKREGMMMSSNGGGSGGGGGGGSLGKQKIFETKKEKKRPRLILSDSEESSEEDLLVSHPRVGIGNNSDVKNSFRPRDEIEIDRKRIIRPREEDDDHDGGLRRNGFVEGGSGRKRSRMDDGSDGRKLKKEIVGDKATGIVRNGVSDLNSLKGSGKQRGFGNEFRRSSIDDKGNHSSFDKGRRLFDERDGGSVCRNDKKRFEVTASRSVPTHKEKFGMSYGEPIRLQGKNGVLKVMVKHKNTVGGGSNNKSCGLPPQAETRKGSLYGDNSNCKASLSPPFYSERKYHEKSHPYMEKNQVDSQKMSSMRNNKVRDWKIEACDKSLQMGSKDVGSCSSKKAVRRKEEGALTPEIGLSTKRKEEARRGNGTEKQILRERIRTMLVNEGWTIDFRPRKNRDYQDAVYRSPAGTEYWSILRAYDALLKEREDDSGEHKRSQSSSSFTPIPEEVLSKLTRQTRKKIERDMETPSDDKGGKTSTSKETTGKKSKNKFVSERPGSIINGKKLDSFLQDGETVKENMKEEINLNIMELSKSQKSIDLLNKAGCGNKEGLPHEQGNLTGILNKALPKPNIVQNPSFVSDDKLLQGRKNRKQNRCLLVRSSNQGVNSDDDDYIPYPGKRTVLSWLIDLGTVPLSGKVRYMNKKRSRTMLEGWITRDGIHCSCCSKILTVSKFEIHAGSKLRQPFQNIFIETGDSLFQCQLDAWNNQEESDRSGFQYVNCNDDDPNDDTCGICGDGGDLICCDGCPSTFHQNCLGIEMLPPGDWHCSNCSCSFCGVVDGNAGQGEDATFSALLTCSLCEEKYHGSCGQETDAMSVDLNNPCTSFCGPKCRELFEQLQKLLGVKHDLEAGFSWCLIKRSDLDPNIGGLPQKAENNSKIAVALTVMDECFLPIVDRRSGINLIHNVLYNCGSNFNRLNYSGFYTVVLERGDEIISAATIRIHGTRLAEMPFIGTRHIYRRQGMFRRLLNAIESVLCSLNVERLIIPAISDLMHTWTMVFGFKPLEKSEKQEIRSMNMLMFPDTDLLQKLLVKQTLADGDVNMDSVVSEVAQAVDLKKNQHSMYEVTGRSDIGSITDPVAQASDKVVVHHAQEMNDIAADIGTGGQASGDLSCGIPDVNNNLHHAHAHAPASHVPVEDSALDTKFLGSAVTNHIEVEKKPVLYSSVEVQSLTEGAINDAGVASVEIAGTEPDLHSLAETSVQHTDNPINEYPHSVTGHNFQVTDPEQSSTELNHYRQEVKSNSAEACYLVSDVTRCEEKLPSSSGEGMAHDAFELNTEDAVEVATEIVAVEPDPCTSRDGGAHQSAEIDTQPQDVALVENDLVGTNQSPATVSECNLQGLDGSPVHHDPHLPQMILECSADAPDTFPDARLD